MQAPAPGERSEFGFKRTSCGCRHCAQHCRHTPGYLLPGDLERLMPAWLDRTNLVEVFSWASTCLAASPGAIVSQNGRRFRIPTLVPRRNSDGSCIHFSNGLCHVHANAPFGCAFFDYHMGKEEASQRSTAGLQLLLDTWRDGGHLYCKVWQYLADTGRTVPGPEATRGMNAP